MGSQKQFQPSESSDSDHDGDFKRPKMGNLTRPKPKPIRRLASQLTQSGSRSSEDSSDGYKPVSDNNKRKPVSEATTKKGKDKKCVKVLSSLFSRISNTTLYPGRKLKTSAPMNASTPEPVTKRRGLKSNWKESTTTVTLLPAKSKKDKSKSPGPAEIPVIPQFQVNHSLGLGDSASESGGLSEDDGPSANTKSVSATSTAARQNHKVSGFFLCTSTTQLIVIFRVSSLSKAPNPERAAMTKRRPSLVLAIYLFRSGVPSTRSSRLGTSRSSDSQTTHGIHLPK